MTDTETIQLRVDPANLRALEEGIHLASVRLARGEDGVFEMHIAGDGVDPLPHPRSER